MPGADAAAIAPLVVVDEEVAQHDGLWTADNLDSAAGAGAVTAADLEIVHEHGGDPAQAEHCGGGSAGTTDRGIRQGDAVGLAIGIATDELDACGIRLDHDVLVAISQGARDANGVQPRVACRCVDRCLDRCMRAAATAADPIGCGQGRCGQHACENQKGNYAASQLCPFDAWNAHTCAG